LGQYHPSDQSCTEDSTTCHINSLRLISKPVPENQNKVTHKAPTHPPSTYRPHRRRSATFRQAAFCLVSFSSIRLRSFLSQQQSKDSLANMEEKVCECSSNKDSDNDEDEVYLQNASDEEDFQFSPGSLTKLQFRLSFSLTL
jgi:hypothetical protein